MILIKSSFFQVPEAIKKHYKDPPCLLPARDPLCLSLLHEPIVNNNNFDNCKSDSSMDKTEFDPPNSMEENETTVAHTKESLIPTKEEKEQVRLSYYFTKSS